MMGRRKGDLERRLGNPVFKMAEESMADLVASENFEDRPFRCASFSGNLPCPHISCRGEAGKVFFEEKGLSQHFRAKHVRVFYDDENFSREAWQHAPRKAYCRTRSSGLLSICLLFSL